MKYDQTDAAIEVAKCQKQNRGDENHLSKSANMGGRASTIGCGHCQKVPLGSNVAKSGAVGNCQSGEMRISMRQDIS